MIRIRLQCSKCKNTSTKERESISPNFAVWCLPCKQKMDVLGQINDAPTVSKQWFRRRR